MSRSQSVPQARRLTVAADFGSLEAVRQFVAAACQEAGLSEIETYKVQLAVDEACSNIIEHAYVAADNTGEIECQCNIAQAALIIQLHDSGKPFNPENIPSPNTHLALEERKSGGLGLYFIRQYMDEVIFHSVTKSQTGSAPDGSNREGNYLILVKRTGAQK